MYYIHTCAHTYTHTHAHIHIHTYTYTIETTGHGEKWMRVAIEEADTAAEQKFQKDSDDKRLRD